MSLRETLEDTVGELRDSAVREVESGFDSVVELLDNLVTEEVEELEAKVEEQEEEIQRLREELSTLKHCYAELKAFLSHNVDQANKVLSSY